ncbi:hypothetical protein [Azospirillum palustre]|uniref:hypothetical protein n=1 Tax=Azospirillum palustre TaxID=2044885 RepID=UPI0011778FF5|nr:hypothetical protein [Azospirillum palustre]
MIKQFNVILCSDANKKHFDNADLMPLGIAFSTDPARNWVFRLKDGQDPGICLPVSLLFYLSWGRSWGHDFLTTAGQSGGQQRGAVSKPPPAASTETKQDTYR